MRKEVDELVAVLLHGNQLKRTPRTGWLQRGVTRAESVAAHSYGVVFTALVLSRFVEPTLDLGRVLAMAALHDLPEGLTTDIPTPAWRLLPPDIKSDVERKAMQEILSQTDGVEALQSWWEELTAAETAEAQLVHDADRLDMYLQAAMYEQQQGNVRLEEFWQPAPHFYFALSGEVYQGLRALRPGANGEDGA